MIVGIKVDEGAKPLAGSPNELVTEGLDGLHARLVGSRQLGARFAKWRAVIQIAPGLSTPTCVEANAEALARYAALCQENGLVPIVEPEVLIDGDHTIERCFEVTQAVQHAVVAALYRHHVDLEATLLKPSMVLPGNRCAQQAGVTEVATATLRCLRDVEGRRGASGRRAEGVLSPGKVQQRRSDRPIHHRRATPCGGRRWRAGLHPPLRRQAARSTASSTATTAST